MFYTDVIKVLWRRDGSFFLLSGQEASGLGLEGDDDHSDLQVSLLLQLSQNSCAEEDLTLPDPVQVWVQVQMLDLHRELEP